jgi:hypothetical protein
MTLPRPIPTVLAALGALVILSAAVGIVLTFTQTPPAWFFFGFELVVLLASGFLVALGMGKIKEGPAITLLCCAGAIGAGSLLGWKGTGQQINGHSITWLVALRGLVAAALLLAAAAELALRDPKRTLPRLAWGVALTLPLLAMAALYYNGTLSSVIGRLGVNYPALAFGVWVVVGVIAAALMSAAGHMLITGFTIGVEAWEHRPEATPSKPGAADRPIAAPAVPSANPATTSAPTSTPSGTTG